MAGVVNMADEVTVKVEGVKELIKNVRAYQFIKKEAIRIALVRGGYKVELAAKEMCPVITNRLRSSITTDKSEVQGFVVKVGTNVKYAPYVEHGHRQTPGRFVPAIGKRLVRDFVPGKPYLHPALFMFEGEIIKDIKVILKKDEHLK